MTLHRLLTLALISQYCQWEWFRDCTLEKTIILCPDKQLAESLTRCWLPQIQQVLPLCEIRVGQAQKVQTVKAAYRGQATEPVKQDLW